MASGSHSRQYSIMPLIFSHSLSSALLSLSPLSMSLSLTVATFIFFLKNSGSLAWLKWKTEVILQVKPQGTDLVCNINSSSRTSRGCWLELFETFAGSVVIHSEGFYHVQHFFFFLVIVLEIHKNQKPLGHLQVYDSWSELKARKCYKWF